MTNTIPNVPRELLEVIEQTWRIHYQGGPVTTDLAADAIEKGLGQLRALLSAPSPAGVDGLEVFAWSEFDGEGGHELRLYENNETFLTDWLARNGDKYADWVEPLCRLSDAQAIIDGLRGEVAELQTMLATVSKAGLLVRNDRDQQAQRIGALAFHLEFAVTLLTVAGLAGNAQVEAMRAALSAGNEPNQCT